MRKRFAFLLSALCNAAMLILALLAIRTFFVSDESDAFMTVTGVVCFRYFTIDSNLLAALASLPMVIFGIVATVVGEQKASSFWLTLKYVGTVAVAVTFATVMLFLGPTMGYREMTSGSGFWLHLICPLLAAFSFLFLDGGERLPLRTVLYGMLPTVIYGALYAVMVLIVGAENGGWPDFYGFTAGGLWYVSFAAMLVGTAALAIGLLFLRNLVCRIKKNG